MKNRPGSEKKIITNIPCSQTEIVFTPSSVLSPKGKDLISNQHKSYLVYTFECCCSNNFIGQTSRHLETRIKEHVPKCVKNVSKISHR